MLITNLIGGLGNQMFQYAVGRSATLKSNTPLRLDISDFSNYGLHQGFELHRIFNCPAKIASEEDIQTVLGWQGSPIMRQVVKRPIMKALRFKAFVVEPHFQYWSGINSISDDCYLYGYWQSEKYFMLNADVIREDFTFKLPMSKQNSDIFKKVNQGNSVSLHVRRGDYVNNSKVAAVHGSCSIDYYNAAIAYIAERVKQPHFYIFSDDIIWVKNNLKIDVKHQYVDHNFGAESYSDMRLMSACKHNIIANSSFSWWGAWLNSNPEKIVVAPRRWFSNLTDVKDLLPRGWVSL